MHIQKAGQLDHIGALVDQAKDNIIFEHIEGYDGFRMMVGKWAIDVTKPMRYHQAERRNCQRVWPIGWG